MIFARICYYLTIMLSVALIGFTLLEPWLDGREYTTGNILGFMGALCICGISISQTKTTRIIIGILYGLSGLQITFFALIAVSGVSGAHNQFLLVLFAGLTLVFLSVIYFLYKPLKQFLNSGNV